MNKHFESVYALVCQIPAGKVTTYGQIARWLGWEHGARTVGWALRSAPADIPWHRVVNGRGGISLLENAEQRLRLESEGVVFDALGRINLKEYGFVGPVVL
ncbi:MAG: MGMT family protein [Anaerolineae bacterium]|jgi:methylated-DNA-protein-cysteine methyltransferase-like protein|nr:MGMT family protein [Anaerolineae bacterium]